MSSDLGPLRREPGFLLAEQFSTLVNHRFTALDQPKHLLPDLVTH